MMVIGVDPHKQSHTAVAVDELGRKKAQKTVRARRDGHRELIAWAREIAPAGRLRAVEDVRHVAGGLIRELLAAGEQVVFVPPKLMAGSGAAGGSGASPTRSTRWRSRGPRCARTRTCPPPG
jgi:transposase